MYRKSIKSTPLFVKEHPNEKEIVLTFSHSSLSFFIISRVTFPEKNIFPLSFAFYHIFYNKFELMKATLVISFLEASSIKTAQMSLNLVFIDSNDLIQNLTHLFVFLHFQATKLFIK